MERPRTRSHHNPTATSRVSPGHPGERRYDNSVDRSFATKNSTDLGRGGSRCPDIIHDQDIPVTESFGFGQSKSISYVVQSFLAGSSLAGGGWPSPGEGPGIRGFATCRIRRDRGARFDQSLSFFFGLDELERALSRWDEPSIGFCRGFFPLVRPEGRPGGDGLQT